MNCKPLVSREIHVDSPLTIGACYSLSILYASIGLDNSDRVIGFCRAPQPWSWATSGTTISINYWCLCHIMFSLMII
ncbi:hypothetical protein PMI25_004087 [Pseudomonas sp. GM30]|nr:hypothetical protein PMI25_004087 [Pseudomonas sp. GM30]